MNAGDKTLIDHLHVTRLWPADHIELRRRPSPHRGAEFGEELVFSRERVQIYLDIEAKALFESIGHIGNHGAEPGPDIRAEASLLLRLSNQFVESLLPLRGR